MRWNGFNWAALTVLALTLAAAVSTITTAIPGGEPWPH